MFNVYTSWIKHKISGSLCDLIVWTWVNGMTFASLEASIYLLSKYTYNKKCH